jgi:O-antigen/teichoic acid export membrane protein
VSGFIGGVSAISVLGMAIGQADKLLLSGLLRLDQFAQYSVASTAALLLLQAVNPINAALQPRLVQARASHAPQDGVQAFRNGLLWTGCLISPLAASLMVMPGEFLRVWLGSAAGDDPQYALVRAVLPWLVAAVYCNCLTRIPYSAMIATGNVSFGWKLNLAIACIHLPMLYVAARIWGPVAAAATLVGANLAACLLMTRHTLTIGFGERGLLRLVAVPALHLAASALIMVPCGIVAGWTHDRLSCAAVLGSGIALSWGVILASTPVLRSQLRAFATRRLAG